MASAQTESTQLYIKCALFGPSSGEKTTTTLRMAKGIAEKMGVPVTIIDIEKPGKDFGEALYEWLRSGDAPRPETAIVPARKGALPPATSSAAPTKGALSLKEQSVAIIKEIGDIVTSVENGQEYFSEDERNDTRQLIQSTRLNEEGIKELLALKECLADELAKRSRKAA